MPRSSRRWMSLLVLLLALPAEAADHYDLQVGREVAIGSAVVLGGLVLSSQAGQRAPLSADDLAALDPARLPGYDRGATRCWSPAAAHGSDLLVAGLVAAPLALLADPESEGSRGELVVMALETIALTQVATGAVKLGYGRTRPYAYNTDPRIPDELRRGRDARRSFPSGHTSAAFAGAMFTGEVYARLYPDHPARHWVRGGTLGLAALAGYLRVRAGRHFPSDVVAGAALGAVIGWLVPRWHDHGLGPVVAVTPGAAAPVVSVRLAF
ncbi:MAG: phosphatase PAP2 family protein [Candidatus Krumholzibacteriia bacterium]